MDEMSTVYKNPETENGNGFILLKQSDRKNAGPQKTNAFLIWAAMTANLMALVSGICFAWTSPVLPKLNSDVYLATGENPLGRLTTPTEDSWIASLLPLGAAIGPIVAGKLGDLIGRKTTLILATLPLSVAFGICAFAPKIELFYFGRILMGIGLGSVFTVLPTYLAEIAENHNRGLLGTSMSIFVCLGLLAGFSIGPYVTIRDFCLISIVPLAVFLPIFIILMPESPEFLAKIRNVKKLKRCLRKLRGKCDDSTLAVILKNPTAESRGDGNVICDLLIVPRLRRGIIVSLGLIILQQFSGINAVMSYMQSIFSASKSNLAPEVAVIIVAVVQVGATVATSYLVEKLGRRLLLLISLGGSLLSLISLGVYFHLQTHNYQVGSLAWLPIASLLGYIIFFNLGIGPLSWTVMAEIFPSEVKSAASAITSCTCFIACFVITLMFPSLAEILGMALSFWLFAGFCFIGCGFVYFFVPETKGRTLKEIQDLLSSGRVS